MVELGCVVGLYARRWGKTTAHTESNLFLKAFKQETIMTEAGSPTHYFTNFTEKADPLSRMGSYIVEMSSLSVSIGRGKICSVQHLIGPRKY